MLEDLDLDVLFLGSLYEYNTYVPDKNCIKFSKFLIKENDLNSIDKTIPLTKLSCFSFNFNLG